MFRLWFAINPYRTIHVAVPGVFFRCPPNGGFLPIVTSAENLAKNHTVLEVN